MEKYINIDFDRFTTAFLAKFHELSAQDDRLFDKYEKAEAEGNTAKMQKLDRRMDMTCSKMDGMHEVLAMLGFVVKWQEDHFVIVYR